MDLTSADPFNQLVLSLTTRIRDLRGLMLLRTPDSFDAWQESISDLNSQLLEIEKQMALLKERVTMEKKLIPRVNEFKAMVLAQQEELQYMQSHLPARLPGKVVMEPTPPIEPEKTSIPAVTIETQGPTALKKIEPTKKASSSQPPIIQYVTVDELESTPKYMKGRLTLDKVNTAIDELQKTVDTKYKILSMPIGKMNDKALKKYKGFRDMENVETKNLFFLAESDLSETTTLKQGDATGKAILSVLRHLHRLKDLGGSTKRFSIVG